MPPREPRALLDDALAQIDDLSAKVNSGSLAALLGDRDLQAIFERRFEVLGESLRRLERVDSAMFARIVDARLAVDVRNFISHGYDGMNHRALRATAANDLVPMRQSIMREVEQCGG